MSLLFMDSFDHYATADILDKWTSTGVLSTGETMTISSSAGRRSSGALRCTQGGSITGPVGYVTKVLAPADATCVVGFSIVMPTSLISTAGYQICSIRDGSSAQVSLRVNSDFTLTVTRGTHAGTVLGTASSLTITAGTATYVEMKVLIHASAGTVDVHINGVSAIALTSQNTRNTATAQWNGISLGMQDSVGSSTVGGPGAGKFVDCDDFYVLDGNGSAPWNTFLGDVRVDPRYPTAEGNSSSWTPFSGTDNALMVDETAPNDDTDYNSTSTVGHVDTHVVQDAPVVGGVIFGIQHCLNMKKSDAGTCLIAPVIRHSTTDYVGADLSPSTGYLYGLQIAQTNPGTSAQWTESGFNAAEFGYKRTA